MSVATQGELNLVTGRAPTYARDDEPSSRTDKRGPTGELDALRYRSSAFTTLVGAGSSPLSDGAIDE